jgi:hypothetical protein
MMTIIKYIFTATVFYFGINWIADNPNALVSFRDKMNELVATGIVEAKQLIEENFNESG